MRAAGSIINHILETSGIEELDIDELVDAVVLAMVGLTENMQIHFELDDEFVEIVKKRLSTEIGLSIDNDEPMLGGTNYFLTHLN